MGSNAFNIGISGLRAAQVGLDVTSHNIANVNTPFFKRQIADLSEVSFPDFNKSSFDGAGVSVSNIKTNFNSFLNRPKNDAVSNKSYADKLLDLNNNLSNLLNNPLNNLSRGLQDFFNSYQEVANNPTSLSIRQNAINAGNNLVQINQNLATALNEIRPNIQNEMTTQLATINSISSNIARLNQNLNNSNYSSEKQSLIYQLSELVDINISPDQNTITTKSGQLLVQNTNSTVLNINNLSTFTGGKIGALNDFLNNSLPQIQNEIPDILNNFTSTVNNLSRSGFDLNGNPGTDLFLYNNPNTLSLSLATNSPQSIAASTSNIVTSTDGTNAQNISQVQNQLFNFETLQQKFNRLIGQSAINSQNSQRLSNTYNNIYNSYQPEISGLSDVNLDEEAVNLMKYQRMYEANAQVIKTANEMLGTLLNIKA